MTTLNELYQTISREINRGTQFDEEIPEYVRRAIKWAERNHTMVYMQKFVRFTLDPEATYPRSISVPDRMKSINFLRLFNKDFDTDGNDIIDQKEEAEATYLRQVQGQEFGIVKFGVPTTFWIDSDEYIWLNAIPQEKLLGQLSYNHYSPWPYPKEVHPLLDISEDFLLALTIILMSPRLRNPTLREFYAPMRAEGLRTIMLADEELRNSARDEYMELQ